MSCSPIHLMNDMSIWYNPVIFDKLTESYREYADGVVPFYDCGITSAPCESNVTKELIAIEPGFVYWFDMFIVFVGLTVVSLAGIVGNTINVFIISTTNIANDSTNNLYLWLSVSDLLTSLNCGALVTVCFLCFIDNTIALSVLNMTFPFLFGNINKISLLSLDFVAVISVQRAVAIVFPFKISSIFTNRNTNIIIILLILLTVITNLPLFIGQQPRYVDHPYFEKEVSLGLTFTFGWYVSIQYLCAVFYTRSTVDLFIIVIAIPLSIYKLEAHGKSRLQLKASTQPSVSVTQPSSGENTENNTKTKVSSKSVRENKVIKMSITICVVTFVIFCFNIGVQSILEVYSHRQFDYVWATNNCGLLLYAIGASFNFFLYITMSTQYREVFLNLCRGRKK